MLIEWSDALLRDWHKETTMLEMPSWDALVKTRANILVRDKEFDMQLEVMMSTKPQRFCVNPKMHVEAFMGSEEEVRVQKEQCWTKQEEELERNLLRCQNL